MSRCRSTHKVVPGAMLAASGTSRAVTGCAPLAAAAALAGGAAASATPRITADRNARRQEYLKSRKAIAGRIIAEIAAIRRRVATGRMEQRNGRGRRSALSSRGIRSGRGAMAGPRTLAVDIGGTGVKLALLDPKGRMIGKSIRVPTPMPPVAPEMLTATVEAAAAPLGSFHPVAVGLPRAG